MILPPESSVAGSWLDKKGLRSGDVVKIVSEPKIETGQNGEQLVAKVKVKGGDNEAKNLAINKPSRRALVEMYGQDTSDWIDKTFTVEVEKTNVGGKRGIALHLIPEGYEVTEDSGGYIVVQRIGQEAPATPAAADIDYPDEEIKPEDIPF